MNLQAEDPLLEPLRFFKGVGPARSESLAKLGLHVVRDLLHHLPHRYEEWKLPLLGRLPLEEDTRIASDQGEPIVIRAPKSSQTERFHSIARKMIDRQKTISVPNDLELPSLQQKH